MSEYHRYVYIGPVLLFDSCITGNWKAETMAVSKEKALSNLKHQYKKKQRLAVNSKIDLPGKLKAVD
jgi:hypothetical protein